MAASTASSNQIFSINPYEGHPNLTQLEADVLWEYAKLNQHIKDVRIRLGAIVSCALFLLSSQLNAFPQNHSWLSRHAL